MATVLNIQNAIALGDAYSLMLTDELLVEEKKGCLDCCDMSIILSLIELTYMLERRLANNQLDSDTDALYECLLTKLIGYSGSAGSVNPNASIPNTIIDVTVISDGKPNPFDFNYSQMETADQDADGGRYTYINPLLDGWNPMLQDGTRLFYRINPVTGQPENYDMYKGGIIKFRPNNAIYESQSIRADNFQPYDAPPLPPAIAKALIDNRSSFDVLYNDNFTGSVTLLSGQQFFKNPIINGQSLVVRYPPNTTFTLSVYNANGTIFQNYVDFNNTGGLLTFTQVLDATKRYEFIVVNDS